MIRKIIHIDEEKCNGCGLCATACHEGAIEMINGKAKLVRENFCDGLGDCLPNCPTGAISFEEREAPAYDEMAVKMAKAKKEDNKNAQELPKPHNTKATSKLSQWPCQIKLIPTQAPYFDKAKLLIAADCTAYAYANIHEDFMNGRITLIGCPKLDAIDYSEKLAEVLKSNDISDVLMLRMQVPCCGGLQRAVENAINNSGKSISYKVVTISREGDIVE